MKPTVKTKKGYHYYVEIDDELLKKLGDNKLPNKQGLGGFDIDIRGDGGCIVAPPSSSTVKAPPVTAMPHASALPSISPTPPQTPSPPE